MYENNCQMIIHPNTTAVSTRTTGCCSQPAVDVPHQHPAGKPGLHKRTACGAVPAYATIPAATEATATLTLAALPAATVPQYYATAQRGNVLRPASALKQAMRVM